MSIVSSYKNLIIEIEIAKKRIEGLEYERELVVKSLFKGAPKSVGSISYDGMPKGSAVHRSLDRTWEDIRRIDNMLFLENEILKNNLKIKNQMNERIDALEGIEYKIVYMRDIEGESLNDIAKEIGYNYDYVRRVYARYKKSQSSHRQAEKNVLL